MCLFVSKLTINTLRYVPIFLKIIFSTKLRTCKKKDRQGKLLYKRKHAVVRRGGLINEPIYHLSFWFLGLYKKGRGALTFGTPLRKYICSAIQNLSGASPPPLFLRTTDGFFT